MRGTKVGSLGFMCVMMCYLMPSLADMDSKSLLANVTALSIIVITLVVNIGIQIETQVIMHRSFHPSSMPPVMAAYIFYMGMSLFLLIIYISSAVTIPTFKKIMEFKYQATLNDQIPQENHLTFNFEELRQLLKRHWIMAKTSSPQFVLANTPLSSASGIICAISMVVYIYLSWHALSIKELTNASVYRSSTSVIFATHFIGVVAGGLGSIYRCFAVLRFKSFANQSKNHFSRFKVDKYWTKKLCEWKENPLNFYLFASVGVNYRLSNKILSICIGFQKATIVSCKIIEFIPIMVIFYCSYYFKSLKAFLFTQSTASCSEDDIDENLSNYVLTLEDNVHVTDYSSKRILVSMNRWTRFINRRPRNNDLLKLVEKSVSFEGVETFDIDQIQSLLPIELVNTWSLPIISLTCIAIAILDIDMDAAKKLLRSVDEGLFFTRRVEESLYKASEYVNVRRASVTLWREVRDEHKWLGTTLKRSDCEGKTPTEIIKLFAYNSEKVLSEFRTRTNGEINVENENIPQKVIAANSMYRIARTILHRYERNNLEIIEDELFTRLSSMIADILVACLSNIPRVIKMKCNESAIEKREASVVMAVPLLDRASEMIKRLETRQLPNMDPEKMAFIDEWRLHFKQP